MLSGYTVTCTNKNQRGVITRLGGDGWSMTSHDAIVKILSEQIRLIIQIDGKYIEVGIRGNGSDAYLALEPDGFPLHDLTNLPSC